MTTRHRPRPRRRGRIRGHCALLLLSLASSIGRVDCCCWGNGSAGRTPTALSRKPATAMGFLPLRPATPPPLQRRQARSTSTRMRAPDTHSSGQRLRRTALLTLPGAGLYLATSAASGFALEGSVERTLAGAVAACTGLAVAAYGGEIRRALISGGDGGGIEGEKTAAEGFVGFQRSYLAVQALATFVDFIQGPFLYKVYADTFGLGTNDIALLYLVGFGASALASPVAGPFADAYGRRLGCMAFAGLQAASSLLLHLGPALLPLALGRLLSGAAAAFLATCFEAWMVAEHTQRRFPAAFLPSTFSLQVFVFGATAVGAGAAASAAVDVSGGSYLAPFDVCAAVSAASVLVIPALWRTDNYGVREEKEEERGLGRLWAAAREGAAVFMAGRKEVLWLGLTQVCFEAALFTWVFLWTPALESAEPPIPKLNLGLVFAALMVGVSAGGTAFRLLVSSNNGDTEGESEKEEGNGAVSSALSSAQVLSGALALAASSLGLASLPLTIRGDLLLATFVLFEVAVGAYSAAIADLRARLLPDPRRATLMNQTRLAQNALVVAMYLGPLRLDAGMGTVKRRVVLGLCAGLMLLAAAALLRLRVAISLAAEEREEGRGG